MLRVPTPRAVRALAAAIAPRPEEQICVVLVGPDGPTEGTVGFLPAAKARWFMELCDEYESRNKIKEKDNPAWRSPLGGVALQWHGGAGGLPTGPPTRSATSTTTPSARSSKDTLGLTIEADEDEDVPEEERDDGVDVDEWVDNHPTEIDEAFQLSSWSSSSTSPTSSAPRPTTASCSRRRRRMR